MSCVFGNQELCEKCKNAITSAPKDEINSVLRNGAYTDCIGIGDEDTPRMFY
jgi:ribosome biogenesis protein Nip4